MSFRITPEAKEELQRAARKSGRSLSQEAEFQLRRGLFTLGAGPTSSVFAMIATAVDSLANLKDPAAHWTTDPYLFDQAVKAINGALELLRPQGVPPAAIEEAQELGGRAQGQVAMLELLREVQLADPSIPLEKQTPHQRALVMLQMDLGPLVERMQVYGRTAEQTRAERAIGRKLLPLSAKLSGQGAKSLTADEARQYLELLDQLCELQEAARAAAVERKATQGERP